MKILLTGATGFLGKYVIDELKNNSYQVVAFGRNEKIGKTMVLVSQQEIDTFRLPIEYMRWIMADCHNLIMLWIKMEHN